MPQCGKDTEREVIRQASKSVSLLIIAIETLQKVLEYDKAELEHLFDLYARVCSIPGTDSILVPFVPKTEGSLYEQLRASAQGVNSPQLHDIIVQLNALEKVKEDLCNRQQLCAYLSKHAELIQNIPQDYALQGF